MKKLCLATCLAFSCLQAEHPSIDHSHEIADKGIFEPTETGTLPGETESESPALPPRNLQIPSGKQDISPIEPRTNTPKKAPNKSIPATPQAEKGIFDNTQD